MSSTPTIIYTLTDEAPFLATQSLLPIVPRSRAPPASAVETRDISLAGTHPCAVPRIADADRNAFPTTWPNSAQLAPTPDANIIKLPNISASVPQLKAAIKELQAQGYALPDYPDEPADDAAASAQGALRQAQGQRGESGAARRQFRSPRAAVGEEVCAQASAPDGRVER